MRLPPCRIPPWQRCSALQTGKGKRCRETFTRLLAFTAADILLSTRNTRNSLRHMNPRRRGELPWFVERESSRWKLGTLSMARNPRRMNTSKRRRNKMPEETEREIEKRGGAKRWRTVKLPDGRYMHVAVTREKGPRGGTTVASEPKEPK